MLSWVVSVVCLAEPLRHHQSHPATRPDAETRRCALRKIRVLIADDHAVLREGIASLIDAQSDMEVVAQAADGYEAISKTEQTHPDVAIVDVTMPGCGGISVIEKIRKSTPRTRALVLSMYDDPTYLRAAIAAGSAGYVAKRSAGKQLLTGIREVHAGRSFINIALPPDALQELLHPSDHNGTDPRIPLSRRELEVLTLLAHGYTNRQIAQKLAVSKKTIDTYRIRVSEKLGLKTRADIVRYALDTGLLRPEDPLPSDNS